MSDSQDSIDNELKIKIPKRARFIAIGWLFTCGVIFSFWLNFSPDNTIHSLSLGDIGAFLSGIFSILAFYGFIEAYLIQSKELKLQRFELKESIKVQQGSEIALKEQSKALEAQLAITEKQFNQYQDELRARVPIFRMLGRPLITVKAMDKEGQTYLMDELDYIKDFSSENVHVNDILDKCSKSIEISFKLNNIAMECYVTDISIVRNDVLGNNGLLTPIKKDGEHNSIGQIDNYQFSFSIFGDDIDKLSVVGNFEYIYKLLSSIVIKISYRGKDISSTVQYLLYYEYGSYCFMELTDKV